jgi:hypothetical protein
MNSSNKLSSNLRLFCAVALISALTASAHAQTAPVTRYGEEDKPKTAAQIESERRAEAAYKRSLGSVPDARSSDPWGGVRSEPAAKTAPAKKNHGAAN